MKGLDECGRLSLGVCEENAMERNDFRLDRKRFPLKIHVLCFENVEKDSFL